MARMESHGSLARTLGRPQLKDISFVSDLEFELTLNDLKEKVVFKRYQAL